MFDIEDTRRFYDTSTPEGMNAWVESQKRMIEEHRKQGYLYKMGSLYPEKEESDWDY